MTETDKIEFVKRLMALGELFDKSITDSLIDIYYDCLKKYNIDDYIRASSQLALTCKFFPKPAEYLELLEGNQTDKANLALIQLEKAIEKHGYYSTIVFPDKIIHAAVDAMGGWMEICKMTVDDWKYKRKEFINIYNTLSKRPIASYPEKLIGFHEQNNRQGGFLSHVPTPIMIGEGKKLLEKGVRG